MNHCFEWGSEFLDRPRRGSRLPQPATYGLFDKRIQGDDCLWELARLRFQEAGMGAEVHAANPDALDRVLRFQPMPQTPVMVHLPRELDWAAASTQRQILEFASRFAGRVRGFVVHDHRGMASHPEDFRRAAQDLDQELQSVDSAPILFIEYAVGLEPRVFSEFFATIRRLTRISACIDTGHAGIRQARQAYERLHPSRDICALKSQPDELRGLLPDVEAAVRSALPSVTSLIHALGALGKPIHFHLHDGHPLSTFSPFGVSDHLSFLAEIPLRFEFHGRRSLPLMFGPAGLGQIVDCASAALPAESVSFTLEIHPTFGRLDLGDAAPLFNHWTDKTNAEQMNHWLATLAQNHELLLSAIRTAQNRNSQTARVPAARPPPPN